MGTLSNVVSIKPDSELDIPALKLLLNRVEKNIHTADNRVRSSMNGFVIALGSYISSLTEYAIDVSKRIGEVIVIKEGTACKVPDAADYIKKIKDKGAIGKKKKMARC